MPARFDHVNIKLVVDDAPIEAAVMSHTFLGGGLLRCQLNEYIAQTAPDFVRDPSAGRIWSQIRPKDGKYTFEIATSLPYYLPTVDGKSDYLVEVDGAPYFVSSRIVRAFSGAGFPVESGYFLAHLQAVQQLLKEGTISGVHIVPLKTYISRRLIVDAPSASDAIEQHFLEWRDSFASSVARVIEAVRTASPREAQHLLPLPGIAAFPTLWLFVVGDKPDEVNGFQFAGDLLGAALRPLKNISRADLKMATSILAGTAPISTKDVALGLARAFCHHGFLDLAIVQLCVGTESSLWRAYQAFILGRGGSKAKLEELENGIQFSELLNGHLFAMKDVSRLKDSAAIIGRLNWARKLRNDAVHTGVFSEPVDRAAVDQAIDAAERLTEFLDPPTLPVVPRSIVTSLVSTDNEAIALNDRIAMGDPETFSLAYGALTRHLALSSGRVADTHKAIVTDELARARAALGIQLSSPS